MCVPILIKFHDFQLLWFAIALIGLNLAVAKIDIRKVVSRVQEYSTQVANVITLTVDSGSIAGQRLFIIINGS